MASKYAALFDDEAPAAAPKASKYGALFDGEEAPAAAAAARPVVDMGPEARRARALAPQAPRTADPEPSGPQYGMGAFGLGNTPVSYPREIGDTRATHPNSRIPDVMETDTTAQNVVGGVLGGGAAKLVAAPLGAFVGPRAGNILTRGIEGSVAAGTQGGDPVLGAAFGAAIPAAATAARAGARTLRANPVKDITKGATKAPAKFANEVKFKAERGDLADVIAESPDARRAILVEARTKPGAATKTLDKVVSEATDGNSADFAAIQRQHGGVELDPIAQRLVGLEERLNLQGRGVSADAVGRFRADIVGRYGKEPGSKLTAQQIRNIRNDMGTIVDPQRTIQPNTKRQALAKIYDILNKEIEDVAANTRGVDVAALKVRNRRISTLIPVRDALKARAESEAELSLGRRLKNAPGNAIRRGIRELAEVDATGPSPTAAVTANQAVDDQ